LSRNYDVEDAKMQQQDKEPRDEEKVSFLSRNEYNEISKVVKFGRWRLLQLQMRSA
jgi:hypothetical protein